MAAQLTSLAALEEARKIAARLELRTKAAWQGELGSWLLGSVKTLRTCGDLANAAAGQTSGLGRTFLHVRHSLKRPIVLGTSWVP